MRALGLPVVSGNVSLYNETNGRAIHPTPVVGAVGLVEDVRRVPKGWREGDSCSSPRRRSSRLAGSEFQSRFGEVGGSPPRSISRPRRGSSRSSGGQHLSATLVHDAAEGGLAVCLAEAAIVSESGAGLDLADDVLELFGEVGGRAVVSCAPEGAEALRRLAGEQGVPLRGIGTAGGATLFGVEVPAVRGAWESCLMCGVFGIRSEERDVSRLAYFGLFALQHRGQESAGSPSPTAGA